MFDVQPEAQQTSYNVPILMSTEGEKWLSLFFFMEIQIQ